MIFPEGFGWSVAPSLTATARATLFSGRHVDQTGRVHGSAYLLSTTTVASTDKTILATGGEYLPTLVSGVLDVTTPDAMRIARHVLDVVPGSSSHVLPSPFGKVGVLFCNEVLSPEFTSKVSANARLLVVIASHSWFPHSEGLELQTRRALQVRAVHARTPVVQVANQGYSYAVSEQGTITASARPGETLDTEVVLP